jgi:hypothetical protein
MSNYQFPQFAALPAELRIKIWQYASSSPSILAFKSNDGRPFGLTEASRIARVCTESRDTVSTTCQLMQYRCMIGNSLSTYRWIDFQNTFFYLDTASYDLHSQRNAIRIARLGSSVQHLAIRFDIISNHYRELTEFCQRLVVFPNLKTLVVVRPPAVERDAKFLRDNEDLQRLRKFISGEAEIRPMKEVGLKDSVVKFLKEQSKKSSWKVPEIKVVASDVM